MSDRFSQRWLNQTQIIETRGKLLSAELVIEQASNGATETVRQNANWTIE